MGARFETVRERRHAKQIKTGEISKEAGERQEAGKEADSDPAVNAAPEPSLDRFPLAGFSAGRGIEVAQPQGPSSQERRPFPYAHHFPYAGAPGTKFGVVPPRAPQ